MEPLEVVNALSPLLVTVVTMAVIIYTILFAAWIDETHRRLKNRTLTVGDVIVFLILSPAVVVLIPIWIVYEITSRIRSVLGRILSTPIFKDSRGKE